MFAQNVGIGVATPQSKLHVRPNTAAAVQVDPYGGSLGQTGDVRFLEITPNGVDYVGFKAPDAIAANRIWVLPAADGAADEVLRTDGSGLQFLLLGLTQPYSSCPLPSSAS